MSSNAKQNTNKKSSVAVIGRGIAGLSIALALLERGLRVTVFGPSSIKEAASSAAVGLQSLKGIYHAHSPLFSAKIKGAKCFPSYLNKIEAFGGKSISRSFDGTYELLNDREHYQRLRERIYHGHFTGAHKTRLLPCVDRRIADLRLISNPTSSNTHPYGAFFYSEDGFYNPQQVLEGLFAAICNNGADFVDIKVKSMIHLPAGGMSLELSGGETAKFDEVVVAAGSETPRLLQGHVRAIPFMTTPGQTLVLNGLLPGCEGYSFGKKGLVLDGEELRFGSVDHAKNQCPTEHRINSASQILHQELADLTGLKTSHLQDSYRFGVRLALRDRLPLVGALEKGKKTGLGYMRLS